MDQNKYKINSSITAIVFLICLSTQCYADDLEKPLVKLPQVNITGQQDSEDPYQNSGIVSADIVSQTEDTETHKDEAQGFITSSYGNFESKLFEIEHSVKSEMFYYNAHFKVEDSGGDRENSQFTTYKPNLELGIPLSLENEVIFNVDYFDKRMGLPGKITLPTLNAERNNSDILSAISLTHTQGEASLKIAPYYGLSIFNDALEREDLKNKVLGFKSEGSSDALNFTLDTYQDRLANHYKYGISKLNVRTNPLDINEQWQSILGINAFAQEQFGQRYAPFLEMVFKENEDCLHKFTWTRNFEPVLFNKTYLEDNYVEVNPEVMRPVRSSEISYNLDKHISTQWRANVLVYYRKSIDYWFLADTDNDGFYSPVTMKEVNTSGINLSTEYNWSEAFNYFLSLDVRKIRSKDTNYEFVPFEPKQKISAGLTYQITDKAKIDFIGDYFGRRYYSASSKESSSVYFLLGSKLTYNLKDYLTFFALVDNLLNDHYEIVRGYPTQSRSVLSGVTLRF